jgi:uncharacterized protein (DUF433 family)
MARSNGISTNGVIVRRAGVMGGSAIVAGTRIRVSDIVRQRALYRSHQTARILRGYPDLTREQVEAALAYYAAHRDTIDEEIRSEEALATECRASQASTQTTTWICR